MPPETETPVTSEAPPADRRAEETVFTSLGAKHTQAQLSSHLDAFKPLDSVSEEAAEAAEAAKVVEAVTASELPATLKDTLAAIEKCNAFVPSDKFEAKVNATRLDLLRAHHHTLCQAPKPAPINYAEFLKPHTPSAAAIARVFKTA